MSDFSAGHQIDMDMIGRYIGCMNDIFDISSVEWKPVRPEVADGVLGRAMLDSNVKAVLTRVVPGGKFRMHADKYAHLFYFLSGQGIVWVDKEKYEARPGTVVQVDGGTAHAYENTGTEDLVLVSLNLPL
jgi:mannose-6-phosphate isomerase-like protein (cupin superfamily)